MRQDLEQIFNALEDGFTILPPQISGNSMSFKLNNLIVWGTATTWVAAELNGGIYSGHKYFKNLVEALEYTKTR